MHFHDSVITNIPIIRFITCGMVLGEIGNIHHFSNPSKLLAVARLDSSVYQSGNFQTKTPKMSKRNFRVLCYSLVNMAWNVVKSHTTFKTYMTSRGLKAFFITMRLALPRHARQSHLKDAY